MSISHNYFKFEIDVICKEVQGVDLEIVLKISWGPHTVVTKVVLNDLYSNF